MKGPSFLLTLFLAALTGYAQDSSDMMMKIVTRDITPGVELESFAAKPKTLYRIGDRYGRVEELPDAKLNLHGLMVIDEPKIWVINLWDKTGKLIIDPGPTYIFRAAIIPSREQDQSPPLKDFEFGKEYDFLRSRKATRGQISLQGKSYDSLNLTVEGYTITLLSHAATQKPYRVKVEYGQRILCEYEYDEYQRGLTSNLHLFSPPSDVKITETLRQ
jgi:hypothetical protein